MEPTGRCWIVEQLKNLNEIFTPDPRASAFPGITLERHYERLSQVVLADAVPEDIRNYFETVKNICLYGRFVYAFYAVAEMLTFPLLELALRVRLRPGKKPRKADFRTLLEQAMRLGLIREEDFSHIRGMKEQQADYAALLAGLKGVRISVPSTGAYLRVLEHALPSLRNLFAHPEFLSIQFPGGAFFAIRFAAEFINQLYGEDSSSRATQSRP